MSSKVIAINGAGGSASAYLIANYLNQNEQALIIVPGRVRSERLAEDLSFFCDREIMILPPDEEVFLKYEAKNQDQEIERAKVLKAIRTNENLIVIATASGAIKRLPQLKEYENNRIQISVGKEISLDGLKESLTLLGYERTDTVFSPGQFSVRGGILDIFTPDNDEPYRIEFFGDEVDSLRSFDVESQRSVENRQSLEITPALLKKEDELNDEDLKSGEFSYIWDFMLSGKIFVEDPDRINESLELRYNELWNDLDYLVEKGQASKAEGSLITGPADLNNLYNRFKENTGLNQKGDKESILYFLQPFAKMIKGFNSLSEIVGFKSQPVTKYNGHMDILSRDIRKLAEQSYHIIISASAPGRVESLTDFLREEDLDGYASVKAGYLGSGMIIPDKKLCYISDGDIFDNSKISGKKRRHKAASKGKAIQTFTELHKGEYVVHDNHGIGVFQGIEELNDQGVIRDYIKIRYKGHGILYVPVEQMDVVQKYIGSEGKSPKINKLGSDEWRRTKQRARKAVAEMTDELIELYAKRKAEQGYAFSEDTVWQADFENAFPYEETPDQLRSIEEIKIDMEKEEPMDRLLCGDVGYGKTEVAARAIFKCLIEGKQAAMLVPTTILASQHFDTLKDRLKDYPFTVELMSRFRSEKDLKIIAEKIAQGKVDLVIGTHRILSKDVKFKDLGLLVVDEEQRFGVAHKESLKHLKAGVDVLTLSATPIPRTLNMSLTGIRDMSLISEPPEERYPVQTYVMEQDDDLIREVINRELDRGGQVFVVYNRVRGIITLANKIKELVPEAKVSVGHGQMNENSLEEVMRQFVSGETDVLVATTIVESGLDIPNANTLIVLESDKCGLSQLYQLRGRVGRSNKIAYAYLMYQKEKVLTEVAEKRLRAIKEFTEFGAGFKIAMRDMELRGAGNVLGAEQSGHMMDVGYEMYARLVEEAAKKARGEEVHEKREDFTVELKSAANIPSWYIEDESIKLAMYKRIADITSSEDAEDVMDELMDRFGEIPKETMNLIKISIIRTLAEKTHLSRIHEQNNKLYLTLPSDIKGEEGTTNGGESLISPYTVMKLNEEFGNNILFHGGKEPYFALTTKSMTKLDDAINALKIMNM